MSASELIRLDALELRLMANVLDQGADEQAARAPKLRSLGAQLDDLPPGAAEIPGELRRAGHRCEQLGAQLEQMQRDLIRRAHLVEADNARPSPDVCLRLPKARWEAIRAGKQSYWDGVKQRFGIVADFLVLDALRTLRNPNASPGQKALATATLFGPGKVAGKVAGKGAKLLKGEKAADAGQRLTRVEKWQLSAGSRSHASKALAGDMEKAGVTRLPGYEAHHIVAPFDRRAVEAQKILARLGVKPNEVGNGVYLPGPTLRGSKVPEAFHRPIHTQRYYDALAERLGEARTKADALAILSKVRRELQAGAVPGRR